MRTGDGCDHQIIGTDGRTLLLEIRSNYSIEVRGAVVEREGHEGTVERRSIFSWTRLLFRAPNRSSAFTTLHRAISLGGVDASRVAMVGERPVRYPMQAFVSSRNRIIGFRDLRTHPVDGGQRLGHQCYQLLPRSTPVATGARPLALLLATRPRPRTGAAS